MSFRERVFKMDRKFSRWLKYLKPEDRGGCWIFFAVVGVVFIFVFLNAIWDASWHNQPFYDAVLIFFGGTFGSALWDTFKWAFLYDDEDDKNKSHRPKTEIIEKQRIEISSVTPAISDLSKSESNTETGTTLDNAVLYLTQVIAAAAIFTIIIQIISLSQINIVIFNFISLKVLTGCVFFIAFVVLLTIFYNNRFGKWPGERVNLK